GEGAGLGPRRGEGPLTAPGGAGGPAFGEEAGLGPRRGEGPLTAPGGAGGPAFGERPSPRFFEAVAEHAGAAYLRYSFTRGTEQEVDFLTSALELRPGMRVVDVGCGPGRHVRALTDRGMDVVGIDISHRFLQLLAGARGGSPVRADARWLPVRPGSFDAAICLCQGGFGLLGGVSDERVVGELA